MVPDVKRLDRRASEEGVELVSLLRDWRFVFIGCFEQITI